MALRRCLHAILETQIGAGGGQVVFDLGCGDRPYEPLIRSMNFDYVACDIEGDVDVTMTPGVRVDRPDHAAAGVVSFQVLEHVWDLDWYLGECRRLLKPGGWLLLSTHGTWPYHPHPTDYRRWTRDGLVAELQTRGFLVTSVHGLVGPLAWTTQIRALGYRQVLLRVPGAGLLVNLLMAAMNLRMVVEDAMTPATIVETNACMYVVLCRRG
jgi:SAM-dependent methyltransferase